MASGAQGRAIARSPQGDVTGFDVASSAGRLFLVWADDASGMFFSQANIADSYSWSAIQALSHPQEAAVSPSILSDEDGKISIAFAVQLNEPRGVYLLQSPISGLRGLMPGGFLMGPPRIGKWLMNLSWKGTTNGQMHLLWTHRSLPPEGVTRGLAYIRSDDQGQNWSEANMIFEGQVPWSRLIGLRRAYC